MIFTFNGRTYDTSADHGENLSNDLQNTKDRTLQRALVNAWFFDEEWIEQQLRHNTLQLLFDFALAEARYVDIIQEFGLSDTSTYPSRVLKNMKKTYNREVGYNIEDIIKQSKDEHEALQAIQEYYSE